MSAFRYSVPVRLTLFEVFLSQLKSILVIEDSHEIQVVLKLLLEQAGYSVSVAESGNEALQIVKSKNNFALIILDLTLPDMTAIDLLKKFAENHPQFNTPVVLCSAASDLKQMTLPPQVVGVLPKPFQVTELYTAVEKYCNSPKMR